MSVGVDLKTDMEPGADFSAARVRLAKQADPETAIRSTSTDVATGRDLTSAQRIALFEDIEPGTYRIDVELVTLEGLPVVGRVIVVEVRSPILVTALISRDCEGVTCPGPDDPPNATTCRGGRCVDARCRPESSDYCPGPACVRDSDCGTGDGSCGVCVSGVCLYPPVRSSPDGGTCGTGPTCTDGMLNGDETDVDCGGSCPPCSSCTDGMRNGDETGIDCGGSCDPCPSWEVGDWGDCEEGTETRSVQCKNPDGTDAPEARCTEERPNDSRSCAWAEYAGFGCETTADTDGLDLDNGACDDRPTCSGCPTLPENACRDHCLDLARDRGEDYTCVRTGCETECWVFEGHGFEDCGSPHHVWFGHAE